MIDVKNIQVPEHATVEMCRRNHNEEKNCEILDMNKFRVTRPIVFAFNGNGGVTLKNANGFAKYVENYLELMFKDKEDKRPSDYIDIVSFKYARTNERRETGTLTELAISQIVNMMLPLFIDDDGKKLPIDIAKKNMSMITFFSYCMGAQELEHIIERLDFELEKVGYSNNDILQINNSTTHISFAPWTSRRNSIPSIRFVSTRDGTTADNLVSLLSDREMASLEGVQICREKEGMLYGKEAPQVYAGSIQVISGNFVNSTSLVFDEHNFHFVSRNADWDINKYEQDGNYFSGENGDCVSQMIAWALCRGVENSLQNQKSDNYIEHSFNGDLFDELKSIRDGYSKESLATNYVHKAGVRRKSFNDIRKNKILEMARQLEDFVPPASLVYAELQKANTFESVFVACEKFNYNFVEDILKEKDFLTNDQKVILQKAMARQREVKQKYQDKKLTYAEILEMMKNATSFEEIESLANRFGRLYMTDVLPTLLHTPDMKYNITQDEVYTIMDRLTKKEKYEKETDKYKQIESRLKSLEGKDLNFENIITILEEFDDYMAAMDLMPIMANGLNYHQIGLVRSVAKLKRKAILDKQDFVTFPIFDEMLEKINNANSITEIIDYLKKYDFVGVEYLLPEVVVLTKQEKEEILRMAGKTEMEYTPSELFE